MDYSKLDTNGDGVISKDEAKGDPTAFVAVQHAGRGQGRQAAAAPSSRRPAQRGKEGTGQCSFSIRTADFVRRDNGLTVGEPAVPGVLCACRVLIVPLSCQTGGIGFAAAGAREELHADPVRENHRRRLPAAIVHGDEAGHGVSRHPPPPPRRAFWSCRDKAIPTRQRHADGGRRGAHWAHSYRGAGSGP